MRAISSARTMSTCWGASIRSRALLRSIRTRMIRTGGSQAYTITSSPTFRVRTRPMRGLLEPGELLPEAAERLRQRRAGQDGDAPREELGGLAERLEEHTQGRRLHPRGQPRGRGRGLVFPEAVALGEHHIDALQERGHLVS